MTRLLFLTFVCCLISSISAHGGGGGDVHVDDSDVIVLTTSNFDDVVNTKDLMLVEFYAPWCGHCKKLTPEYAQAATALLKNDPPVYLAKVDATVESSLASKYKVSGYPTLFLFRNGRESPYNGPREAKGIIDYMKKQVGPAAKPLNTISEYDKFVEMSKEREYCVVGVFEEGSKPSQLQSSFLLVTSKMREDYSFGIVTNKDVAKHAGVDVEAVIGFKNYDDKKTIYNGPTKKKDLEDWIVLNSFPIVGEFTAEKGERYHKRGLPVAKFYMTIDWSPANVKHTQFYISRLEPIAVEFRDKILTTIANSSAFDKPLEDLGWKGKNNVLVIESGRQRYKFEKEFKAANVRKFYSDFLSGSLTPYIKSETPPANNDGPVKVVVGSTFQQIVNNPDHDVLIEFYAPWCGHCKQLEPKYKKLGEKFKGVDSVVIAKMDATANDYPPEYEVSGFPTIFLSPSGKNSKPIPFEGGQREVNDFVDFIKKNAKTPWSFPKKRKNKHSE